MYLSLISKYYTTKKVHKEKKRKEKKNKIKMYNLGFIFSFVY
ncbi:hypothetical protein LCGC14_0549930 [marine sediment metagenome]|uniref:Uncharacterized protein n=1 Tax=marine sediment metagenome TaxID=412755 RepID=A0A0F9UBI7_9ZZZZ